MRIFLILLLLLTGCWDAEPQRAPVPDDAISASEVVFLDGDTFRYKNQSVRLLGCDTPEVASPHHHGAQEPWGGMATSLAWETLRNASLIQVQYASKNDKYGRRLAHLVLDGVPLAVTMIEHGLAYESVSHYGDNGFPEYSKMILEAVGPKPEFKKPWEWRRSHR